MAACSPERVEKSLLNYFRGHVNDTCRNCAELMRLAFIEFRSYVETGGFGCNERFVEMFNEMQFSFIDITHSTDNGAFREAFELFMVIRIHNCYSPRSSLHHSEAFDERYTWSLGSSMDLFSGQIEGGDYGYSPDFLLSFKFTRRFLRYRARFGMSPHQRFFGLEAMLKNFNAEVAPSAFQMDAVPEAEMKETVYRGYCTPEGRGRLFIVLLLLYVTLMRRETEAAPEYREAATSVKLVFQTIEDPFVTLSEVSRYLNLVLTCDNKERKIEETCKRFVYEFPNAEECMAPRSLKHLTRCRVRRCMGKSRTLSHGVCDLGIPKYLKNYILIQETNDEYNPKYMAALAASKRSVRNERSTEKLRTV